MTNVRQTTPTAIGVLAIANWGALAPLAVMAGEIPPFELLSLTTGFAFLAGTAVLLLRRGSLIVFWQPPQAWVVASGAIFLYHALYFYALKTVPPAHASLIAYFWPVLIVVLSALAPGTRGLSLRHLLGVTMGLVGVALLLIRDTSDISSSGRLTGYLAAAGCALVWSSYSVINRRFARVPSEMLIGVCGVVAAIALPAHLLSEPSITPEPRQWIAIMLLGAGPVGLAFLAWDFATKNGNLALLGSLSYATPLLSTALLILAGYAAPTHWLLFSAILIVCGAVVVSTDRQPELDSSAEN